MADADVIDLEDTSDALFVFIVETQERSLRLSARSKEDKDIWMNHLRAHKLMSNTFEPDPEEKELTPSRIARKFSIHTIKFSNFGAEYLTDTNKPNAKNAATMDNWITKMKLDLDSAGRDKCEAFLDMHKAIVYGVFVTGHLFMKHKHGHCRKRRIFCTKDLRMIRWNKVADSRNKISGDLEVSSILKVQEVHHGSEMDFASRKHELLVRSFIVVANSRNLNLEVESAASVKDWMSLFRRLVLVDWVLRKLERDDLDGQESQKKSPNADDEISNEEVIPSPSPKSKKSSADDYLDDLSGLNISTSEASAASHKGPVIYHSSGRDRHAPQVAFPPSPKEPPTLLCRSPTDSISSAHSPNSALPVAARSRSIDSITSAYTPNPARSPASVHSLASVPSPTKQHRRLRNSVTEAFGSVRASPTMKQFPAKQRLSVTEAFGSVQYHRRRNTAPTSLLMQPAVERRLDITCELRKAYTYQEFVSFYGQHEGHRRWLTAPLPGGVPNTMVTIPRRATTMHTQSHAAQRAQPTPTTSTNGHRSSTMRSTNVHTQPVAARRSHSEIRVSTARRATVDGSMTRQQSPQTPPTLPRENSKNPHPWQCKACTYLNHKPHAVVCEICGAMRKTVTSFT